MHKQPGQSHFRKNGDQQQSRHYEKVNKHRQMYLLYNSLKVIYSSHDCQSFTVYRRESVFLEMSTYLVVEHKYDILDMLCTTCELYNYVQCTKYLSSLSLQTPCMQRSQVQRSSIEHDSCNDYCCCTVSLLECASCFVHGLGRAG